MPSRRYGKYMIYFKEFDLNERPHVHIQSSGKAAKYWIARIECFKRGRFSDHELTEIEGVLYQNHAELLELWAGEMKKKR